MRRKLITFISKNREALKKQSSRNLTLCIVLLIVILVARTFFKLSPTIALVLCLFLQVLVIANYILNILCEERESVLRLNPIALIIFSKKDFLESIAFLILIDIGIILPKEITTNFLASLIIVIVLISLLLHIADKISEYCSGNLK